MMDTMYDLPSDNKVRKCIITKDAVEGIGNPELVLSDEEKPKKALTTKKPVKKNNGEIA